eukprot:TRINITY_DN8448_c0_g1_i2.p1 TRINITY_DN8448_c0_g1~~TRINITY_DN8448_c0_g1_i2.p1  ORF type:complete len:562 (+),score=122.70 TRINITY_DN8448_c0_g1_i2:40-1725(+)
MGVICYMGRSNSKSKEKEGKERTSKRKEKAERKSKEKKAYTSSGHEFIAKFPPSNERELQATLLSYMCSPRFNYPIDTHNLFLELRHEFKAIPNALKHMKNLEIRRVIEDLEEKNALKTTMGSLGVKMIKFIMDVNMDKLRQLNREHFKDLPTTMPVTENTIEVEEQKQETFPVNDKSFMSMNGFNNEAKKKLLDSFLKEQTNIEKLMSSQTDKVKEQYKDTSNDFKAVIEKVLSKDGAKRIDYCDLGTKDQCWATRRAPCNKVHFKKLIRPHTDESLGNCSYLDTCRHMESCKFVHYAIDDSELPEKNISDMRINAEENVIPPQWINCDLRFFDFRILGKFEAIMLDPPWDIHMNLPYGTLKDKEMKALRLDLLQDDGVIFLWVTARAMEIGRECLEEWGYKRVEEIVWVKTNQLQRIIRTGRTGHWLNHSKEHCLVGIKGNPKIFPNIDCDVIVSEVRETSRKPDEVYPMIERMHPGGRKLELFARPHNRRAGWLSLGNQLPGIYLVEKEVIKAYNDVYPEKALTEEDMERNKKEDKELLYLTYHNHIFKNTKPAGSKA